MKETPHHFPHGHTPAESPYHERELYRPRTIEADPTSLQPMVGLFGTCGSPASTWRQDILIPALEKWGLPYFNPQVDVWTPDMAQREAEHLATDEVIVLPISKETHGYASLAEGGWAILSALVRGQRLGLFVEDDPTMPEDARRARQLFKSFAHELQQQYPIFQFEDSMEDLARWAAITARDCTALKHSKIKMPRVIELPATAPRNMVSIFGTSSPSAEWRPYMKAALEAAGKSYFDSYKDHWSMEDTQNELDHKLNDRVIVQAITGETDSFGALAESGLLATSAFVRDQALLLYIGNHPGSPKSDTNRARTLVRAHATRLIDQFPGNIYLADSIEELTQLACTV